MIRTRDFFLFALTVLFLVVGISATIVQDLSLPSGQTGMVLLSMPDELPSPVEGHEAVVVSAPEPDRPSLLASMKAKVAALGGVVVASVTPDPVQSTAGGEEEVAEVEDAPLLCAGYEDVVWAGFAGAQFKEVEGARIVYREGVSVVPVTPTDMSTGTIALPPVSTDSILAQLPLRTSPFPSPACLPQDVVGIATDGSLIRNNEVALYTVFGSETLVGYALDGFPIYGVNAYAKTDACGGIMVGGMYRYFLSTEREHILHCFSGAPVSLLSSLQTTL
ncbi:hypothetical protein K2Q16_04345 [Patescibacteria group bacterium]|nr:hypothetical protein [Patescibacteria group bacterium]